MIMSYQVDWHLNLSISTKLISGFTVLALLAGFIGAAGLYFNAGINDTLNNITDVTAPTVETSDDLIALILEATKVAEEIIADEEIQEVKDLEVEMDMLIQAYRTSYIELQELVKDVSLVDELEIAKTKHGEFVKHAKLMVQSHLEELRQRELGRRLIVDFDQGGQELITALDEFAEENEAEMAKAESEGDRLELTGASGEKINEVLGTLFDQDYPVVEAALKMQRLVFEVQDTAGEYLAETSLAKLSPIESEFSDLVASAETHLAILTNLAETDEDKQDAVQISSMLRNWRAKAVSYGQLFDNHRQTLVSETDADTYAELMETDADNAVAALDEVAETADAISDGADEAAAMAVTHAQTAILLSLALTIIVYFLLVLLVTKTVVSPIGALTNEMKDLSSQYSPSTQTLSKKGDEIHHLRSAFEYMERQLSRSTESLETAVRERTSELEQRTNELNEANTNLADELRQRESLEQQLVHAQKLDGLGTLAGGIAHDFNNMIYVILGCSRIAIRKLEGDHSLQETIRKIEQAANQSKLIVEQVLSFSRSRPPNRKVTEIGGIVGEALGLLRAGLPASMQLDLNISDGETSVLVDEAQIQQLVVNLVTNAFQSYEDRKGVVRVSGERVEIGEGKAGRHLGLTANLYYMFSVEDFGCGMTPETCAKIFDPFFFTTKPVGEGTGLGLSVVHGIITSHHGVIEVTSEPDIGTKVRTYIPVYRNSAPTATG